MAIGGSGRAPGPAPSSESRGKLVPAAMVPVIFTSTLSTLGGPPSVTVTSPAGVTEQVRGPWASQAASKVSVKPPGRLRSAWATPSSMSKVEVKVVVAPRARLRSSMVNVTSLAAAPASLARPAEATRATAAAMRLARRHANDIAPRIEAHDTC